MKKHSLGLTHSVAAITAATLLSLGMSVNAQKLPESMTWTAYDVGSAGYAEASAIADAFGKKFNTRVRIQPSGSSIGRLQPVVQGRADFGYLATETWFATEGTEDFANRRWGPQNLRTLAGRPAAFGMPTAADAKIRTFEDLRGKRMAFVAGNPSLNVKCDAYIGFGGLTRKDVQAIMFPTYAAAMSSLSQGKADATCTTPTTSQLYELESSPRGIHWVGVDPNNKKAWERMNAVAPFFAPYSETVGAGMSVQKPAQVMSYRYPLIVTRADMKADDVYAFMKAMDETFDMYKGATKVMPRWNLSLSGTPPADAPFHEGAVRYLKERGTWTAEHEAWNQTRIKRLDALIAAWADVMKEGKSLSDADFAKLWDARRAKVIASLK